MDIYTTRVKRLITKENLAEAVSKCQSFAEVARALDVKSRAPHLRALTERYGIDTSHFTGISVKHTKEKLEEAVASSYCYLDVAKKLSDSTHGGIVGHIAQKIKTFNIDTSHFDRTINMGRTSNKRKSASELLICYPKGSNRRHANQLRRALLEIGRKEECALCCTSTTWNNKPLQLQVDHIDGDYCNCVESNLRFLCPNCHSQTSTYKVKNARKQ